MQITVDRVRDDRKRDCLLKVTVVEESKESVVAAIHIAAYNGNADLLTLLCESGADVNCSTSETLGN